MPNQPFFHRPRVTRHYPFKPVLSTVRVFCGAVVMGGLCYAVGVGTVAEAGTNTAATAAWSRFGQPQTSQEQAPADLSLVPGLLRDATASAKAADNPDIWMVVWQAQRKAGDGEGAKQSLDAARKFATRQESLFFISRNLGDISRFQKRAGDTEGADATLGMAKALADAETKKAATIKGPKGKADAFLEIASTQNESGDLSGAKQSAISARDAAEAITDPLEIFVKGLTLARIAELQTKIGDSGEAKNTQLRLQQAVDAFGVPDFLPELAAGQADAGDVEGATQTLILAKKLTIPLSYAEHAKFAFAALAKAWAQRGNGALALQYAALISDKFVKENTLSKITQTQISARQFADAVNSAIIQSGKERRDGYLSRVWRAQIRAGDLAGARQTATQIKDNDTKEDCLSAIGTAQAKAGDLTGARATADTIKDKTQKGYVLLAVSTAQIKAGNTNEAEKTADTMKNPLLQGFLFTDLGTASKNDPGRAKQFFDRAGKNARAIRDLSDKARLWLYITSAQADVGDFAGAKQTAGLIPKDHTAPMLAGISREMVYRLIAEAQVKAGDFAGAKTTIEEITRAEDKTNALAQLVSAILDTAKKQSDTAQQKPPASAKTL